ncbi:MAG: 6,7-dimethyl-8-ribityllumazine synthase [Saprospiraceae bacterium]|nr:6,7-dimethyl-8-ribityllumazine synthase [Saprospiraceae bacterium]
MSSALKNLSSPSVILGDLSAVEHARIGIVTAVWNQDITFAMRDACIDTLMSAGCKESDMVSISVPGAFELPSGAKLLLSNHKMDAVICLGCVIKGETKHDEYISTAVAHGIMTLSVMSGKPVIFGVLTPNDMQQAIDRAGGIHGNKGIEAANTAIQMIQLASDIKQLEKKKIGF